MVELNSRLRRVKVAAAASIQTGARRIQRLTIRRWSCGWEVAMRTPTLMLMWGCK